MITFQCDDGSIHECVLPGSYCDEGDEAVFMDDDGNERRGIRIVTAFNGLLRTHGYAGVSTQARKWDPDAKAHDPDGRPLMKGKRDWEDYAARKRDLGENWTVE